MASLTGLILFTILSAYNSGIRIWRTVRSIGFIQDRRMMLSVERMKNELSGYVRDFDKIDKDIVMEGESEEMTFPYLSGENILQVTYFYDKGEDALIRKAFKFSESLKDKMDAEETLFFKADNVVFSYFYYERTFEEEGEEALEEVEWQDSFSAQKDGVPDVIKVYIEKNDKEITRYIFIPQ